jgi:hypothetical protein
MLDLFASDSCQVDWFTADEPTRIRSSVFHGPCTVAFGDHQIRLLAGQRRIVGPVPLGVEPRIIPDPPKETPMPSPVTAAFNAVVLEWLQQQESDAASIEALETDGSDWNGDTLSGFYSEFRFTIRYVTSSGRKDSLAVEGEQMADLWMFVMRSWPATPKPPAPTAGLVHEDGDRRAYLTDSGTYVISDGGGWLPGAYPDLAAALAAFDQEN